MSKLECTDLVILAHNVCINYTYMYIYIYIYIYNGLLSCEDRTIP